MPDRVTPDRAAVAVEWGPKEWSAFIDAMGEAGAQRERERISLGIEGIDTHQIEGTPLRDVLVFREDVFKVIHDE